MAEGWPALSLHTVRNIHSKQLKRNTDEQ